MNLALKYTGILPYDFDLFKVNQFIKPESRLKTTQNSRGVEKRVPNVVDIYNRKMGGVDLADQHIQVYDPDFRSVKLWNLRTYFKLHISSIKLMRFEPLRIFVMKFPQ
jgi:hypothetical protein